MLHGRYRNDRYLNASIAITQAIHCHLRYWYISGKPLSFLTDNNSALSKDDNIFVLISNTCKAISWISTKASKRIKNKNGLHVSVSKIELWRLFILDNWFRFLLIVKWLVYLWRCHCKFKNNIMAFQVSSHQGVTENTIDIPVLDRKITALSHSGEIGIFTILRYSNCPPLKTTGRISTKFQILEIGIFMRKTQFTDSQIMAMLKQNEDGEAAIDICREHWAQLYKVGDEPGPFRPSE